MSFYSLKHALEPEKIDAAVDAVFAAGDSFDGAAAILALQNDVSDLETTVNAIVAALPTSNPGAGILWNDNGVIKVGTA